jgi:pSer/pThr/pTyr-binding forkhead associated (FHA) protein
MAPLPTWQLRFSRRSRDSAPEVVEFRCDDLVVGRKGCDLSLGGAGVSRHHCDLTVDARGRLVVVDRGSTNGTFVNGERLAPQRARVVRVGDELRIGEWRLVLDGAPELVSAAMARSERLEAQRDLASGPPRA